MANAYSDNLKFLMGDKTNLEMYVDKGKIEIEALTYIRGRSYLMHLLLLMRHRTLLVMK